MKNKLVSIVISAYNEEKNVSELHKKLCESLNSLKNVDFEFLFVDDGSSDETYNNCLKLQKKDKRIKIVKLKRNFGHEIAMTAGMDHAKGDAVIFMDSDLQHPPFYIPKMIEAWQNGKEIVLTKRVDNKDTSKLYKLCAKTFYYILNKFSDQEIMESAPDFRLIDRKYVDFLKNFNEQDRLFRGLLSWVMPNENVEIIDFVAPERFSGQSKYNFLVSLRLAINSIVQFSVLPLRLATYFGLITAFLAVLLGVYVFAEHFFLHNPTPGYATLMITMIFLGSVQLIALGIIGEYIGKIHMEVKKRPLYMADYIEQKATKNGDKKDI